MTRTALTESIKNAEIELNQLNNTPDQIGFYGKRREIARFIIRMKKELHDKNL